jgi:hypothetical protein
VEYVASGTGIGNTYEFLAHKHSDKVNPEVHAKIQAIGLSNRARVITDPAHTTVSSNLFKLSAVAAVTLSRALVPATAAAAVSSAV